MPLVVLAAVASPIPAWSKGPPIRDVVAEADRLLGSLDYEEARQLLRTTIRSPRMKAAPAATRALLWAMLGRARAELGHEAGAAEAFRNAVRIDRRVKLPRSTSPKILDALEHERRTVRPRSRRAPRRLPPPPDVAAPRRVQPRPGPAPKRPGLRPRVVGVPERGKRVELIVELSHVPARAQIEAMVRGGIAPSFVALPMARTGSVATASLRIDRPRFEVFFRARMAEGIVAMAPPPDHPITIEAAEPPSLEDAWAAETRPPQLEVPTTETSSVATSDGAPWWEGIDTWMLVAGGAVAAVGIVALLVAVSSTPGGCEAERGYGCTEIEVQPLLSF